MKQIATCIIINGDSKLYLAKADAIDEATNLVTLLDGTLAY